MQVMTRSKSPGILSARRVFHHAGDSTQDLNERASLPGPSSRKEEEAARRECSNVAADVFDNVRVAVIALRMHCGVHGVSPAVALSWLLSQASTSVMYAGHAKA